MTTSLPSDSRSSVPSSLASSSGCRSGAMIAPATRRSRLVAAAIADSSTTEDGQGMSGGWLPGTAYSRGLAITPAAPAAGPSTMCSLSMTPSIPACSASAAIRTSARRSRGEVIVQFSLSTRSSRGVLDNGVISSPPPAGSVWSQTIARWLPRRPGRLAARGSQAVGALQVLDDGPQRLGQQQLVPVAQVGGDKLLGPVELGE